LQPVNFAVERSSQLALGHAAPRVLPKVADGSIDQLSLDILSAIGVKIRPV
jgi:hypothetical protein